MTTRTKNNTCDRLLCFSTSLNVHIIIFPSVDPSTPPAMDCFHDFCLACDRESTTGPYCSQACRLADLEKATSSSPNSPGLPSSSPHQHPQQQQQSSWASSGLGSGSGYFLPQAYKFPDPSAQQQPDTLHSRQSQPSQSPKRSPRRQDPVDSQRSLTPSSSRTSLSSNHSTSNSMSEQAKHELQEYFSAFHQTKSSKRRQSTW